MARELTANFGANTSKFDLQKVRNELKELNSSLDANKKAISENNKHLKELEKEEKQLAEDIELSGGATKEQKQRMNELATAIGQARVRAAELKTEQAELKIDIASTTAKLKEQKTAANETGDALNSVKTSAGELGNMLGVSAAALTAVVTALGGITLSAGKNADDINTLAKQYGLTTEEIQKFKYATDLIDVSLEAYTSSLRRNIRSMTQYASGTQAVRAAYDALGVAVTNTDGSLRDSDTVYNEVVKALGRIEDSTQRDSIAMQILGRSAQELNPLILGGADALAELGKQAENLGLILPQEELDKLNAFNDKVDTMKANFEGLKMVVATELADSFDSLFNAGDDFMAFVRELKDDGTLAEIGKALSDTLATVVNMLKTAIEIGWKYRAVILAGVNAMIAFKAAMAIVDVVNSTTTAVKLFSGNIKDFIKSLDTTKLAAGGVVIAIAALAAELAYYADKIFGVSEEVKKTQQATQSIVDTMNKSIEKGESEAAMLRSKAQVYEELRTKQNLTAAEQQKLASLANELQGILGDEVSVVNSLTGEYNDLSDAVEAYIKKQSEQIKMSALEDAAKKAYEQISDIERAMKERSEQHKNSGFNLLDWTGALEENSFINDMAAYRAEIAKNKAIIDEYENALRDENAALTDSTVSTEDSTTAATANAAAHKDLATTAEENKKAAKELADEYKKLASVMQEYAENGSLSLDTALQLIDSGYAACIAIDNETGVVRLNVEAYKELAKAKIDAQKATLVLEQTELEEALSRLILQQSMSMSSVVGAAIQAEIDDAKKRLAEVNAQIAIFDSFGADADKWGSSEYTSPFNSRSNSGKDSGADDDAKLYKDAYNAYKTEADKKLALIERELEAKRKLRDETIAAIDEEIEARKRLNEDNDIDKEINAVTAKLKYSQLDDFSREQLEKQLASLNDKKAETLWQRDMQDRKKAANAEYDAAVAAAAEEKQHINESLSTFKQIMDEFSNGVSVFNSTVNNYHNNTANINMASQALTMAQVTKAVRDALMNDININQ